MASLLSALLALVLAEEARGLMLMSRYTESEERCREGLEVARAVGARAEEGHLLCTLGCDLVCVGHHEEGIQLVREALVIAEEVGIADAVNRAYVCLTSLLMEVGTARRERGAPLRRSRGRRGAVGHPRSTAPPATASMRSPGSVGSTKPKRS